MIDSNKNNYTSDYPPVFFTNPKYEQQVQNNSGFLSNILNSDLIKQFLPLFFGGKSNNNLNFLSILQNINPNLNEMIKSLNVLNSNSKESKNDKSEEATNIIDLSEYDNL